MIFTIYSNFLMIFFVQKKKKKKRLSKQNLYFHETEKQRLYTLQPKHEDNSRGEESRGEKRVDKKEINRSWENLCSNQNLFVLFTPCRRTAMPRIHEHPVTEKEDSWSLITIQPLHLVPSHNAAPFHSSTHFLMILFYYFLYPTSL